MQKPNNLDEKLIDNHVGLDSDLKKKVVNKVLDAAKKAEEKRKIWKSILKQQKLGMAEGKKASSDSLEGMGVRKSGFAASFKLQKIRREIEKRKKEEEAAKKPLKEHVEKWTGNIMYAKGHWNSPERKEEEMEIPVSFHRQHYHPHHYVPSASHFMDQLRNHPIHKKMTEKGYHVIGDKSHFKKGE